MPFPTLTSLFNLNPGVEENPLSNGGKFTLIGSYQKIGQIAAGAEPGWRTLSSNPSVRATLESKKTNSTTVNVVQPAETKLGDLLIVFLLSMPGESVPAITPPAGQGWKIIGALAEATEVGSKRQFGVWWTKVGEGAGEVKVGATMTWTSTVLGTMTAFCEAIMVGTYDPVTPIGVEGSWTKGAASTTPAWPQITTATPEARVIAVACTGSGTPKEFTGYILSENAATCAIGSAIVPAIGLTPEGTYKKTGTKETWAIVFSVRPVYGDGAYWNPATFTNPGSAIKSGFTLNEGRAAELLTCLSNASTTEPSGYVLKVVTQSGNVNCKYEIYKMVKAVRTLLVASAATARPAAGDLIGLTVNGGTVTAWKKSGEGAWTVAAEVADATYTEGNVGFALTTGAAGRLTNFEAASQTHEHLLSTTQAQSPSRVTSPARALATTQPQVATKTGALSKLLVASQAQAATRVAALSRTLVVSPAISSIAELKRLDRTLSTTQGQSATLRKALARTLSTTQTQVASKLAALTRTLSTTQPQVATLRSTRTRTLTVAQPQVATRTVSLSRTLTASQGQTATKRAAVSRTLSATSSSTASFVRALARTLTTSQAQVATQEHTISSKTISEVLSTSQGQTPVLSKALTRRLATSQGSNPTLNKSITHTFTAAQATVATLRRALSRTLTATSTQTATLTHADSDQRTLSTTQGQSATLRRAISRTLKATQTQTASLEGGTIQVPLPPPVRMSSSTSSDRLTSSARTL